MTGRDLIMYILTNKLEDQQLCLPNGFLNLLTAEQAAVKFNVGVETVKVWVLRRYIDGVRIGDEIYILPDAEPRLDFAKADEKLCKLYLQMYNGD